VGKPVFDVKPLLDKYASVGNMPKGMEGPNSHSTEHAIDIDPTVFRRPPNAKGRPLSKEEIEEVEKQLATLLDNGWVEPSTSPYGAPIIFAPKKDGTWRMCVDYRRLNEITIKNAYPLPRIDELLDQLGGAKVFSIIDLQSGYHQVRIKPADREKTAFHTPFGAFQYTVMPFGLCNAPATFQALMNDVFRKHLRKFVLVYLDDILVYSRSAAEHAQHLEMVLKLLQQHKIYARLSKCQFAVDAVNYLGHVVGADGIRMQPSKINAVRDWPEPSGSPAQQRIQLRGFLGLAGYYRRFVRYLAHMAAPLYELLKDDVPWFWGPVQSKAFADLKAALTSQPLVVHAPTPGYPISVHTDASEYAIGAVIEQQPPAGPKQVIAYLSHKLKGAQLHYAPHEIEMLAVVTALKEWRHYLAGHKEPFTLYTDNQAVSRFLTQPTVAGHHVRWLQTLASYNFRLIHVPGKRNVVADALSRRHDHQQHAQEMRAMSAEQIRLQLRKVLMTSAIQLGAITRRQASQAQSTADPIGPSTQLENDLPSDLASPDAASQAAASADIPYSFPDAEHDDAWHRELIDAASADSQYINLLHNVRENRVWDFTEINGLLYYTPMEDVLPRLYVPAGQPRLRILQLAHDAPTAGHLGRDKTLAALQQHFYWPRMDDTVRAYIRSCPQCQAVKSSTQRPAGLLHPLEIPDHCWESVSVDLITSLPPTPRGHDAILVFVCRLSKRILLVPTTSTLSSDQFASLFFQHVFRQFGMPRSIVSDRGSQFTSNLWNNLCERLGISQKLSSAYHPQTDGQTERANRTIEDMLRCYLGPTQHDWDEHLVAIEFAYNNSVQASTGYTPFYLNYGWHPHTPLSLLNPLSRAGGSESADQRVANMHERISHARRTLAVSQQRQKRNADMHRRDISFQVGEKVLLSTANLSLVHTRSQSAKLAPRYIGLFEVVQQVSPVSYRLKLPSHLRIHDVFHVSLLRKCNDGIEFGRPEHWTVPAPDYQSELPQPGTPGAEVERIAGHYPRTARRPEQCTHYDVQWRGRGHWENTREPVALLTGKAVRAIWLYWGNNPHYEPDAETRAIIEASDTACVVCHETQSAADGGPEMILCSACSHGFHVTCLDPPMEHLPPAEDDWYCPQCRHNRHNSRRPRRR
jgi:hypothetical protein